MTRTSALLSPAHDDTDVRNLEKQQDLAAINKHVLECREQMESVSEGIFSLASRQALDSMYQKLLREAEQDDLRAERVLWMQSNVSFLQDTIVKAAHELDQFEAQITDAKAWMPAEEVRTLNAWFHSDSLLEMYRSIWFKGEWHERRMKGKKLAEDRQRVKKLCAEAGLTATDITEIAILNNDARFLATDRSDAERRSIVDSIEAKITAAAIGKTQHLSRTEALLKPAAQKGPNQCVHPEKLGAWLRKIAADPARYTPDVIADYVLDWHALRQRYNTLAKQYDNAGKPAGCAPLPVNAFLMLSVAERETTLVEWHHRLEAAVHTKERAEHTTLAREKKNIRDAVDLKDVDTAAERLAVLEQEHPGDADVRSIGAHIAIVRAQRKKEEQREETTETRIETAHRELTATPQGVPPHLRQHYDTLIKSRNIATATLFFKAIHVHAERHAAGADREEERAAALAAETVEEATIVEVDDTHDAELLVNDGTPPSETFATLTKHAATGNMNGLALVSGASMDQYMQLVRVNERILQNMRLAQK